MMGLINQVLRPVHFRGKYRLLKAIHNPQGEQVASIFGWSMRLDMRDHIQRMIYFGAFEPRETRLLKGYIKPGMTAVDVGANVGYYTALFARHVTSAGRVMAFEPSPYAFNRLSELITQNHLDWCQAFNMGLSDSTGELPLYLGEHSDNHTPSLVSHSGSQVIATVPVRTLDSVMSEAGINAIDLLKIDVEGYEPNVLAGAASLIAAGAIRAILCEFNSHWLSANHSSVPALTGP